MILGKLDLFYFPLPAYKNHSNYCNSENTSHREPLLLLQIAGHDCSKNSDLKIETGTGCPSKITTFHCHLQQRIALKPIYGDPGVIMCIL